MKSQSLVFLDEIENLKQVPRTGYAQQGIPEVESVAEHSFSVAWYAWLLAIKEGADVPRVLKMALFHDAGESRVGDLTLRASEYIGRTVKVKAEMQAVADMTASLEEGLRDELAELFIEYSDSTTLEARIVGDADVLQMLGQVLRYEQLYRADFLDFWEHASEREWLPAAQKWYAEMYASHEAQDI